MPAEEIFKKRLISGSKGKAVLFAGAGCSIDCLNYKNKELPTSNPLLELFNAKLPKPVNRLDIAASMYLDNDKPGYLNLLNDTFYVKDVPDDLVKLMAYDWDRVYTTNYDNALELASQKAGKQARALIPTDDPKIQPANNLQIVHLHGFIERFDTKNVRKDCILDYNSNVANSVYEGHWAALFRNDIATADIVVFVGYSLYDPEIAKLIKSAELTKEKVFFINSAKPNDELEYMQKSYGTPKRIERDGFVQILTSASKQAGKKVRQSFVCFDKGPEAEASTDAGEVKQSDLNSLFMFGNYSWAKAQANSVAGTQNYVIKRDLISTVVDRLNNGADFISVFAQLGFGKTIFAHTLASTLRASGETVFMTTRNQAEFRDELLEIVAEYDRPILILDDFFRYSKHWDTLASLGASKIRIIATARVNVFSSRETEIFERFLEHSPEVLKLGELSLAEGTALVPLITQAGLWEKDAALQDSQKLNKIRGKSEHGYQNNFADILIGLMKSTDIVSRFSKELAILKEVSRKCYDGVLLTIYLEFSNNDPDTTLLQEGFGSDLKEFLNDADTEELLKVFLIPDDYGIRYRSSVFSKYALENACDPDDVVKVIQETVVTLATTADISNDYTRLLADLMRFNYLKSLCQDGNFDRTFDFYDTLSAIPEINQDDLFWNAFGMCERARHNFSEARKYLNTSIANAKNRGPHYVPYHAQNQLIVCILEAGLQNDLTSSESYNDLRECINLLMIQADDERSHGTGQAFSWHKQFGEFGDKYLSKMLENQRRSINAEMTKYSNFISTKVDNWKSRPGASRMVNEISRLLIEKK